MYQGVSPRVDARQWLRTYGGQRPGKTSGAQNRSLCGSAPVLSRYLGARAAHLADAPDIPVGGFGSSPSCSCWAVGWPCSCLWSGRPPDWLAPSHRGCYEGVGRVTVAAEGWETDNSRAAGAAASRRNRSRRPPSGTGSGRAGHVPAVDW
jgi:hypothetical protein